MEITAITSSIVPVAAATGILALFSWWVALVPRLAIVLLCLSLIAGQLLRIPLPGQGGGLLVSDLAVVGVLWAAVTGYMKMREVKPRVQVVLLLFLPFILWSIATLVFQSSDLPVSALTVAILYWVRLTAYILLIPSLLLLLEDSKQKKTLVSWFTGATIMLIALGFLQLILFPRLADIQAFGIPSSFLQRQGWDPHIGRLVSTWLDPNFFGGFILVAVPLVLTQIRKRMLRMLTAVIALGAIAYTQSRSALVGLIGATGILTVLFWFKPMQRMSVSHAVRFGSVGMLLIVWALFAAVLLGDRFWGLFSFDPTVALRTQALSSVWEQLVVPNAVVGVGYNAYQFASQEEGLISSFAIHSRAGADNSWVTLWVTTGIIGIILFAIPWVYMVRVFLTRWITEGSAVALAALFCMSALFIHSQFVNSFLYGHLLVALAIVCSITLSEAKTKSV